jgi:hypothetical protein
MLFIEGLVEPLRGWVKAFRPPTLQSSIMKTQDMADTTTKKAPVKPFIPQKVNQRSFPRRHGKEKTIWTKRLRERSKGRNFDSDAKYPWELGHRCMGKGKVHYIEVLSDE